MKNDSFAFNVLAAVTLGSFIGAAHYVGFDKFYSPKTSSIAVETKPDIRTIDDGEGGVQVINCTDKTYKGDDGSFYTVDEAMVKHRVGHDGWDHLSRLVLAGTIADTCDLV